MNAIEFRILGGDVFNQHVYCEGECVRIDKRAADYDFTDLQADFPEYSMVGAYHVADAETYRPPYNNSYVSVYYKDCEPPESFTKNWNVNPTYGFGLKYDLTTKEVLLKVQKPAENPPESFTHPHSLLQKVSLQGNLYDKNGVESEYVDYYGQFYSYSGLVTFCSEYHLVVPVTEEQYYEKTWVISIVCNGDARPVKIKAYLDMD